MKGYLSYALALCAVVYGIYSFVLGNNEAGMNAIWVGLSLFGVRRAIENK